MLKVYGSPLCGDCMAAVRNFDNDKVEYEFYDIGQSLRRMAEFLKYRDTEPVFEKWKAIYDIGIPCIVDEETGAVFTDWETWLKEKGLPVENSDGPACSIV